MKLLLKNLLFTAIGPCTVAVYLPLILAGKRTAPSGAWLGVSAALFLAGAAIYAWCVRDFAVFGRGTPAPIDAPKKLVIRGPYRYTRNPMYIAALTTILAWAALFKAPRLLLYALVVGGCFHLFVVLYEEPHLRKVFGGSYEAYCARVGRWLPRIRGTGNGRP
ncbi:MAG: methyltransferase family protein [Acidobacteriota bacterium]